MAPQRRTRPRRHNTCLLRHLLVLVKLVGHDDEVGAAPLRLRHEHAGPQPVLPCLVIGAGHFAGTLAAVGVAHGQRLALKLGVAQGSHAGKEAVHIQVHYGALGLLAAAQRLCWGGRRRVGRHAQHQRLDAGLPRSCSEPTHPVHMLRQAHFHVLSIPAG